MKLPDQHIVESGYQNGIQLLRESIPHSWYKSTFEHGMRWYRNAYQLIRNVYIMDDIQTSFDSWVGIVAACSQRSGWPNRNLDVARQVVASGGTLGHLRSVLAKCRRMLSGDDPASVLTGPKIRAFHAALHGCKDACVLDSHMAWILRGPRSSHAKPTASEWRAWPHSLRMVAEHIGCQPRDSQAILWCLGKRLYPLPYPTRSDRTYSRFGWSYLEDY